MSKSLQDILGFVPLTESLKTTSMGIPNPFPEALFSSGEGGRILGDRAKYITMPGERRTAKRAKYGAPSQSRELRDVSDKTIRMLHLFEHIAIDPLITQQLQSTEQYVQNMGMEWVAHQFESAGARPQNTRIIATASVLRHGAIYFDSDNNILPTSAGAAETIEFNVPAANKNQVNGIIATSWATSTTDIPGQLRNLKQYNAQIVGYSPIKLALYGINAPKYMTENEYVRDFLTRNSGWNDKWTDSGEIPTGLFGFDWKPVYTSFFAANDASETITEIWDDDLITFLPDPGDNQAKQRWWQMYEGSFMVPGTLDIQKDPMAALKNFEVLYGQFSYCHLMNNPPGMTLHLGDTFLPGLRNPNVLFQADVAF